MWHYFSTIGTDYQPVEGSGFNKPEKALAYAQVLVNKASKQPDAFRLVVYRMDGNVCQPVTRFDKPFMRDMTVTPYIDHL